jgi:hypothetical protein
MFLIGATVASVLRIGEDMEEARRAFEEPIEMITRRLKDRPSDVNSSVGAEEQASTAAEILGERFDFERQYDDQVSLFTEGLDLTALETDQVAFRDVRGERNLPLPSYKKLVNQYVTEEVAEFLKSARTARMLIVPAYFGLDLLTILADEATNMRIIDRSQDLGSNAFPAIWREHRNRVQPKELRKQLSERSPTPAMFMRAATTLGAGGRSAGTPASRDRTASTKAERAVIEKFRRFEVEADERGFYLMFTSMSSTSDARNPDADTRGLVHVGLSPSEARDHVLRQNQEMPPNTIVMGLGLRVYSILTTLELAPGTIDNPAVVEADGYYFRPANIGIFGSDADIDEGRSVLFPVFRSRNGRTTFRVIAADSATNKHCGERTGIIPLLGEPAPPPT